MEIRAAGTIRSSAARFAHLDGHVTLVAQTVAADNSTSVHAYQF